MAGTVNPATLEEAIDLAAGHLEVDRGAFLDALIPVQVRRFLDDMAARHGTTRAEEAARILKAIETLKETRSLIDQMIAHCDGVDRFCRDALSGTRPYGRQP